MMTTLDKIALLLTAVRNDPDNFEKQAAYFKALADARLDDYYAKSDDLAAAESAGVLYRNQRDELAYELNQTISYLITIEQGNPLRPIADTIAHLVAVLRNMNTAIDERNATREKS